MTHIIQTNLDEILQLFLRSADVRSCEHVDVQDMNRAMNEELSILDNEYDGVLLGGVINPLFRLLDTATIVTTYVKKYTSCVIQYSSQMDIEHIILATEMSERIDLVAVEIKKIEKNSLT